MFTGIIREVGVVRAAPGAGPGMLEVECPGIAPGLKLGDSVAVNGVCLTCEKLEPQAWYMVNLLYHLEVQEPLI